jgi:hypothetical protein
VSLRLWRAPQPYFKLRFCSLIAFGPDCSHFPSAIPNMRENGADLVSAVCEACRGQSRRQRRRHARHHCGPQGQPLAPLQPLRREARLDQAAWPTPDVGRGPDYRPECPYARRPTGAGIRSARAKVQQRMVLAGSHLRLGRNQQAIGAKEQDESHDACA